MRRRGYLLWATGWLLVAPLQQARADADNLQYQYLKIYLNINTAHQQETQGNYVGALANFKDCYTKLQRIHNTDPNWESALVIQRMNDCRQKIIDLSEKASEQVVAPEPPTINPDGTSSPATEPGTGSADVAALRIKLAEVEQRLHDVEQKYANSTLEVQTLHSQLESVNQELATAKSVQSGDNAMGRLLTENKSLTDKLAAAQKAIVAFKSPNPRSALSLMRAQLKNAQDQLAASEASNSALQQTTSTLTQELTDAQSDLHAANLKLAAAPANAPEYETLKKENEVMREILTRELQEQAHRDMAKRLAQEEFDRLRITSKVLQEQLDILGSPMTPPTSDQERELLDSLRTSTVAVTPVPSENGNNFSAPAGGSPADTTTNAPGVSAPATNEVATTTNAAPEMAANPTTNTPTAGTPLTNSALADANSNVPPVTPTPPNEVTPATNPLSTNATTSVATETNTPPIATTPDTNSMAENATNAAPSADTNVAAPMPPTTNAVAENPTATTNTETTPPASTNTAVNNPPSTEVAPPGSSGGTTNVASTPAPPAAANVEYKQKARLPEDMRDTAQQAADLFKMQRYDDAAAKYQVIIDKYPESLYAWSNLGVVRFQQGKMPEALKALQRAVSLSPTDAFSYQNLGIVYYQMNQYENAISALERALALDPTNAKSHNYLGCACSQKGWSEVAEKEFLKAIEIDDTFGDAHFNLALVYATEKPPSLEMARRHYKRALELGISPDPRLEKLLQMDGSTENPAATAQR